MPKGVGYNGDKNKATADFLKAVGDKNKEVRMKSLEIRRRAAKKAKGTK